MVTHTKVVEIYLGMVYRMHVLVQKRGLEEECMYVCAVNEGSSSVPYRRSCVDSDVIETIQNRRVLTGTGRTYR